MAKRRRPKGDQPEPENILEEADAGEALDSGEAEEESSSVTEGRSVEEALADSHAGEAIAALEKHKINILVVVIVAAVAAGGYMIWKQVTEGKRAEAAEAFSAAAASGSIEELDRVALLYPNSTGSGNALLLKADLQIEQGKPEDARNTLLSFITSHPDHPRHGQGLFALGNLAQVGGNLEEARDYYERVVAALPDGDLTPLAKIRLGDIALAGGDKETARQQYENSFQEHPANPFIDVAERKIELLKIGNPPVVKKPVEEAPEKGKGKGDEGGAPTINDAESGGAEKGNAKGKGAAEEPKAAAPKGGTPKGEAPKGGKN